MLHQYSHCFQYLNHHGYVGAYAKALHLVDCSVCVRFGVCVWVRICVVCMCVGVCVYVVCVVCMCAVYMCVGVHVCGVHVCGCACVWCTVHVCVHGEYSVYVCVWGCVTVRVGSC